MLHTRQKERHGRGRWDHAAQLAGVERTDDCPPVFAQGQQSYRNRFAPVADRVRDLLSRMTIDEKAAQMRCMWVGKFGILDKAGRLYPAKAEKALAHGIG